MVEGFKGLSSIGARLRSLRLGLLMLALALVAVSAIRPHWTPSEGSYAYPLHLDEYVHWGYAAQMQESGKVEGPDPFGIPAAARQVDASSGASVPPPATIHERGYQAYIAALQSVTGIPWVTLIVFAPVVVALFTALAVFILAERWGAGVEAVLWLAAVPTTLRFLGPGFLVPIALAIPLVVVAAFVLLETEERGSWLALAVLAGALWTVHAMGALLVSGFAVVSLLFGRFSWSRAASLLAALVPLGLAWPYYAGDLQTSLLREARLPASPEAFRMIGPLVFLFAALGVARLLLDADLRRRRAGGLVGVVLLAAGAVVVARVELGSDPARLYDRSVTILLPLACLPAGVGVVAAARALAALGRAVARGRLPARALAIAALVLVVAVQANAVAAAMRENAAQPYYRPLDATHYERYQKAAEALPSYHRLAIVDGIDTMAWTIVTGIPTLYVQAPTAAAPPQPIVRYLEGGMSDTAFLVQNGVTVVVTDRTPQDPTLVQVVPGVYQLPEDLARRVAATVIG